MTRPTIRPAPTPQPRPSADSLASELIATYTRAEQALIEQTTRLARAGLDPQAAARALLFTAMRRAAGQIATQLRLRAQPLAMQLTRLAAVEGEAAAFTRMRRMVAAAPGVGLTRTSTAAANAIGVELASKLAGVDNRILRFPDDAYRAITADAATDLVLSRATPAQAQAKAWHALVDHGITGYVDRAGHDWNLASYTEVAVRTASQRAFNTAHEARMTAAGIEYFTVNHDGHPCPQCLPFEGKVLTRTGTEHDALRLDEAEAAGLFHPNCRHVLLPYFPGVTNLGRQSEWTDADEARYRATQKLRYLERQVRAAKYAQLGALTPLDDHRARARLRVAQARIRDHVAQHDLVRKTRREQLSLGN
ncbi:minor capsid protein 2 [Jatrophihabitans sp. GAS493]|uniref:phage minor capsid protein n=1 Tax=Jatrophihabitans sp. GAS493 TaxID=1907575 RepID=UPI000BB97E42|nr:phage minor capsid protein [Jatrophihabitans sp. GAS493]SOD72728.1 minor capsid protein 2 [Jatrophihabitans sp. GAS493]